ncbi:MAG TPA: hypothetical protein ACFYD3_08235 [Candidatus Hypogeohydataceae bacterium YC41]
MQLKEQELAQIEAIRETLRAKLIDTMVIKNHLIWILKTLAELLEQSKKEV